ncbi:MAG: HEAT repeat domain-containing protein [Planctomycetota bacterium]|jgi:hypothetical protein
MRSRLFGLLALMAMAGTVWAEEKTPDPAAEFLKEARAKHVVHPDKGLESMTLEIVLRHSPDRELNKNKELATFGYSWEQPNKQDFNWEKTHESIRKGYAWFPKLNLWQELTGVLFFSSVEGADGNKVSTEGDVTSVKGKLPNVGDYEAVFDKDTLVVKKIVVPKHHYELVYGFEKVEGGFRCVSRDVLLKGKRVWKTVFTDFRKVGQFHLPLKFELHGKAEEAKKGPTKYGIEYIAINGRSAEVAEIDLALIKAKIKEFEKAWPKWEEEEKISGMTALAETDHELVAVAIAGKGLRDRSEKVQQAAAKTVGLMKKKKVTPMVISVMKASEKKIMVYLHMIWALGEIGDPRAVPVLSKDWWNQKIGEYGVAAAKGKIEALGKIKHISAIDALMTTLKKTGEGWDHHEIRKTVIESLVKLTGQNFLLDKKAWKEWWKRNRSTFRFED